VTEKLAVKGEFETAGKATFSDSATFERSVVVGGELKVNSILIDSKEEDPEEGTTSAAGDITTVHGKMTAFDVIAKNNLVGENAVVNKDAVVMGELTTKDAVVTESLTATKVVSSGGIQVSGGMVTSVDGFVSEEGSFKGRIVEVGELKINSDQFVVSSGEGAVEEGGEAAPPFVSIKSYTHVTGELQVDNKVSAKSISVSGVSSFEGLSVAGNVAADGDFQVKGGISSDSVVKGVSVMATRIYSDDITANGFLLGNTVKSKSTIEAEGEIRGNEIVSLNAVKGKVIDAEEKVSTMSLSVSAGLVAGGVECRKLKVGEIDVGEKLTEVIGVVNNLSAEIEALKAEIAVLKAQ